MQQTPRYVQPGAPTRVRSKLPCLFLGLPPLLIRVGACVWMLREGRCQPHPQSSLLAGLSLLHGGRDGRESARSVSQTHTGYGGLLAYLTFQSLFCFHIVF
jgi:hypothetical protein